MRPNENKRPLISRIFAISLLAIVAAVVAMCWPKSAAEHQDVGSTDPGLDQQYRELIVGTWQDDYKGRRTLTVRADGTATMVVEPGGLNRLFAQQLIFDEEWSIEGGQFRQKAVGGTPETRVSLILQMMGTESIQKILELTKDRLLLLDPDGKTEYDWQQID